MHSKVKKYILAIDLGTSGPKVCLISTEFEVVGNEFESTDLILYDGGGAEQDPNQWWSSIKAATKRLISKDLISINDIEAISVTAQWSGTVAVDKKGQSLMNSIIWMDSRGASEISRITDGLIKIEGYSAFKIFSWMNITGGAPGHSGKDPIAHILYIKKELPEIYASTFKFLEPKDYINSILTGKFVSTPETMCLHWVMDNRDINNIDYHPKLMKWTGLEREKLPDLAKPTDVIGVLKKEIAEELGLKEGTKVVGGTPDVQAAAIGTGAVRDYEAGLCFGTSSFLTCHVPNKATDIFHNMASIPSGIPGKYFVANEQETAAVCLQFLKNNVFFSKDLLETETDDPDIFYKLTSLASTVPAGSDGLIFTPWLYGERTPVEDHYVRGGWHNLSLHMTRAHMTRAVLEGVAFNARWLLKYIEAPKFIPSSHRPFKYINFIGGGAKSDIWCQILSDIMQRPIRQINEPRHANARGVAALAMIGLGYIDIEGVAKKTIIDKTYQPNENNKELYDKMFEEFINIYNQNKGIYKRLNKGPLK
jgi:xylulokinase